MSAKPSRPTPPGRGAFARFVPVSTRWADNDAYGHINNVAYYAFFDTAVNGALIEAGLLDVTRSEAIALVVETGCHYFRALHYPQPIEVGLAVAELGRSSVRYRLGVFGPDAPEAAATGHFVHVYVDRAHRRPVAIPDATRAFLEGLRIAF